MSYLSSGCFGFGCEVCVCAEALGSKASEIVLTADSTQPIQGSFMADEIWKVEALTRQTVEAMHECPIPNDLPEPSYSSEQQVCRDYL